MWKTTIKEEDLTVRKTEQSEDIGCLGEYGNVSEMSYVPLGTTEMN